ncbi:aldo/keto reductase [Microbispora sp. NPDC049125]|uniref:aldo/keto reductase n=1 Tax=Microbispora sp. NPDC049125 TaxID=3154929 RepID=UPI00346531A3
MWSRRLGAQGPFSSCLGLGGLAMAGAYGPADPKESVHLILHALDAGVRLLDTAGGIEPLVGKAVAEWNDSVLVSAHAPDGTTPEGLERECAASLRSLGVEAIDLYYLPSGGPGAPPIEERVGKLAELVAAGKIRYLGLGGADADELRRAHAVHPVTALAVEYSMWRRDPEWEQLPVARELGVGTVASRPLGQGFLTGKVISTSQLAEGDLRLANPRFTEQSLSVNRSLLRAAEEVAAQMDIGVGRLALAWLLARGEDIVATPSTRDRVHLEMNLASLAVRLAPETIECLTDVFPTGAASSGGGFRE